MSGLKRNLLCWLFWISMLLGAVNSSWASTACDFEEINHFDELNSFSAFSKLTVEVADQRRWSENILRVFLALGDKTRQKYVDQVAKKKFDAKLKVDFPFGKCEFNAKVRIHGDQKDHLSWNGGKPVVSLDVSLEQHAVGNIRKFKLFLPETRRGNNEILITALLQKFGILAPRTRYTAVDFNGVNLTMLFQEKVAKEFLEEFGRREGPIYEGDERFLWGYDGARLFSLEKISLARLVNEKWAARGMSSLMISLQGHALLQTTYQDYIAHVPDSCGNGGIYLDSKILANGNPGIDFEWKLFETIMLAANAGHGLRPHNRKFFFNTLEQAHEPIYYDGSANLDKKLDTSYMDCQAFSFAQNLKGGTVDQIYDLISLIDREQFFKKIKSVGYSGSVQDFDNALDQFRTNIGLLETFLAEKNGATRSELVLGGQVDYLSVLKKNVSSVGGVGYAKVNSVLPRGDFNLEICPADADCKLVEFDGVSTRTPTAPTMPSLILDLLSGNKLQPKAYENDTFVFWGFHNDNASAVQKSENIGESIRLVTFGDVDHSFDQTTNKLAIRLVGPDARALIPYSNLTGTQISISSVTSEKASLSQANKQRFNEYGLTGCLTIYRSSFADVSIDGTGLMCEDGLNIISSSGNISKLDFEQSGSDAVDMDFSELNVHRIHVRNAGNDCLDVSGGTYTFGSLELLDCIDKGFSVGEKSTAKVDNITVEESFIGLSVKDSSVVNLTNLESRSVVVCAEARNKKQEFNGGVLNIEDLVCISRPPRGAEKEYVGPMAQLRRDSRSAIHIINSHQNTPEQVLVH